MRTQVLSDAKSRVTLPSNRRSRRERPLRILPRTDKRSRRREAHPFTVRRKITVRMKGKRHVHESGIRLFLSENAISSRSLPSDSRKHGYGPSLSQPESKVYAKLHKPWPGLSLFTTLSVPTTEQNEAHRFLKARVKNACFQRIP